MRLPTLLLSCALLAACGGGDADPPAIGDVAADVGCTGFEHDADAQVSTRESGHCQVDGAEVFVVTFTDTGQKEEWLSFPGVTACLLQETCG